MKPIPSGRLPHWAPKIALSSGPAKAVHGGQRVGARVLRAAISHAAISSLARNLLHRAETLPADETTPNEPS